MDNFCQPASVDTIFFIPSFASLLVQNREELRGTDLRSYPRVSIASQTPTTRFHYLCGLSKRIRRETRDSKEDGRNSGLLRVVKLIPRVNQRPAELDASSPRIRNKKGRSLTAVSRWDEEKVKLDACSRADASVLEIRFAVSSEAKAET